MRLPDLPMIPRKRPAPATTPVAAAEGDGGTPGRPKGATLTSMAKGGAKALEPPPPQNHPPPAKSTAVAPGQNCCGFARNIRASTRRE